MGIACSLILRGLQSPDTCPQYTPERFSHKSKSSQVNNLQLMDEGSRGTTLQWHHAHLANACIRIRASLTLHTVCWGHRSKSCRCLSRIADSAIGFCISARSLEVFPDSARRARQRLCFVRKRARFTRNTGRCRHERIVASSKTVQARRRRLDR